MKKLALGVAAFVVACGSGPSSPDGGPDASPNDASPDVVAPDGAAPSGAWVMGYYPSWDTPHNGGSYPVSSIDWSGLTHVAAAFYEPDGSGGWQAGFFDQATATELIGAAHGAGKKAIASIGGSNSGAGFEGSMSAANQAAFLASLKALVTLGYDGIDIDWEGGNLGAAQDQALEKALVDGIRAESPSILLTMTAAYENENSPEDLSFYGTIIGELDRLNLMTYGMSGAWQGWKSWHSSALHWNQDSATPTAIDASVAHYLAAGVPAGKLGVGAGFYGECYTAPVTAPSQALGGSQVAAGDGAMSYRNIMASYYGASAYHYDNAAAAPYLTLDGSNAKGCTFVSYEDATSLAAKAQWIESQGLGGIIVWTITEGSVPGATVQEQNPLLEALRTALLP